MAEASIEHLKVYQLAVELETQVFSLVQGIPKDQFYPLGNNVRRASAAIAHYITEAHKRYSYTVKIESLHVARTYAEEAIKLLGELKKSGFSADDLIENYTVLIKQSWGLIKWLKKRQEEKQTEASVKAQDELVAARA
jgi:four helix bundle protein